MNLDVHTKWTVDSVHPFYSMQLYLNDFVILLLYYY